MKLTVLVDNNTLIDRYFYGEPGVSFFIREGDMNILFDVGYSQAFIKNASKMNINLNNIHSVVISHGHIDHTWGLFYLVKLYNEAAIEKTDFRKPRIIAHQLAFHDKWSSKNEKIGSVVSENELGRHFDMALSKEPVWLTDKLAFLGEVERTNNFENKMPIGKFENEGGFHEDYVLDDSAMVYKSSKGLVIITGCSHSGICNIIEYSKKVCGDNRIYDIIGGFHLLNPEEELLKYTCEYIRDNDISEIHPCHCTDLKSKIELSKVSRVNEVGVGTVLEYS